MECHASGDKTNFVIINDTSI